MYVTYVLIAITLLLLLVLASIRYSKLSLFKQLGIPGPTPNIIFGNLHALAGKKLFVRVLHDWTREYGKIYGYYEGSAPVIVTSDPAFLKEVYIKQFNNFYGRRLLPVQPEPDTGADKDVHMLLSRGNRWKRLRSTISPSFSKSKIKQMLPLMKVCIDEMMNVLEKKSSEGAAFDIHRVLQGLTMDVIGTCAFGLEPHFQKKDNDPFMIRCRRLFTDFAKRPWFVILGAMFPEFSRMWWKICKLIAAYTYDDMDWLFTNLGGVIEERKQLSTKIDYGKYDRPKDLLQLLLDAEVGSGSSRGNSVSHLTMSENEEDYNSNYQLDGNLLPEINEDSSVSFLKTKIEEVLHQQQENRNKMGGLWSCPEGATCELPKSHLSIDEVKATSVVFLLAGYETLSNLLAYVTYEMAANPHLQRKLQSELDSVFPNEVECSYEKIVQLQYLEMVISEVLRMYPIASLLTGRLCMETTEVLGITVPQGVTVQPDVWGLHYNPEYWGPTDPTLFDPDRFLPQCKAERDPMVYVPFGAGPKNCVGMRFAITECKLTLARLFKRFNVETTEQTAMPVELIETASLSPKGGIMVKLVPR